MAAVETKVKAGSAGALVAGLIDWLLAKYLFPHGVDATGQALILAAVPTVLSYAAAWLAPHTPRPAPLAALPMPAAAAAQQPAPPQAGT